ncbi:tRNA 5-methoxyuridine(34)/uridine 5-oxyacetic acid(34) synthase CmoB [Psittacicella melopsittaci]|uniref:tRNA 5-methoxyuridine(34)/uridine 5-oxyacetic acid(34) synthase CmoB n=1 Tax=Psittacicella melopsittaci TaxID=2028576 RepID=A0A3A1Y5E1_9GAMM|nr:tRNA 5-methoxyuridine(34)/uridine 5-oxyacetic acid(34) synthase CmoB [Psittacicella melopsittaci]RIY33492.1 tRNA 5-methoxyuridine(34)/uridine 5-oxyacetic acid(34) synthase CmoB [Psittacicella melopsittaci]
MFTNPEDQSILACILHRPELNDWLPALSAAMQEADATLLARAKTKSSREVAFINNLRKLAALENFLAEFKQQALSQKEQLRAFWQENPALAPEEVSAELEALVNLEQIPSFLSTQAGDKLELHPLWAEYFKQYPNELWHKILRLRDTLVQDLIPWRKGPFNLLGQEIDAEWDCGKKWARIQALGLDQQLAGKNVLDVGCGNGYYLWQMLKGKHQPKFVLGVEPFEGFTAQFLLTKVIYTALASDPSQVPYMLTLPLAKVPVYNKFDVVFNMGVLYHRKDPVIFLEDLAKFLTPNGTLVLETIVIDGDAQTCLIPGAKYCGMTNVYFIPSLATLEKWLEMAGFKEYEVKDLSVTTSEEQRSTPLSSPLSLQDFLDPHNPDLTIEGYPRPQRVIIVAKR